MHSIARQKCGRVFSTCVRHSLYVMSGPCNIALRTLRPQDTSAPIFGAEVSRTLRHRCRSVCLKTLRHRYRNVSRHFGKLRQANSRRIGLRRVHADPRAQDRVQLLRHITPVAQHSTVDVTSGTTVAGRLASVVAPGLWLYATLAGLRGNQIDRLLVCDERRCTTCLLCAEVRAHHPATL